MAEGTSTVEALQLENDRLRAQLEEIKALPTEDAQARTAKLNLQSALAAGSIVGSWNWHPARDAFILDEGFARVFGLDATFVNVELPIDRVLVNLHPDDRPGLDAAIAEAVVRGGAYVHQYRIKRSDGKYYWVEAHGHVDYDADGVPVSFPGIVVDVNERRGLEAERNRAITDLRESEARVRAMVEQSSAGIAQTTLDGRFIFVNERFCTLVGRAREDLLKLNMQQLTHPDELSRNAKLFDVLAAGGSSFEIEKRYLRPDGSTLWVRNNVTGVRDADGTVQSIFAVSLDISGQKSAESRQGFLLKLMDALRTQTTTESIMVATSTLLGQHLGADRVGYGVVQPDNETIVFEGNYVDGVAPLTGSHALASFDDADIAAQRRGETVVRHDTRILEMRERWAAIDTGAFISVPRIRDGRFKASFYVNYRHPRTCSAEEVALVEEVTTRTWDAVERAQAEAALRHANDTLEHRVAKALDEREQIEEALRQSQKMDAIGQLTGGIAHDFNNMLATIMSSLELMNRRIASGKGGDLTRYLTLASTAAQSAAALIKRLLAFSRKQTLDLQALDVNAAIAQMQDMLIRSIGENIQFELVLHPDLPIVKSDHNQLENALLNLAINARDAMPEGGLIRISTSSRELDAGYAAIHPEVVPGPYVMVSVSDDGSGMSPEVVAKAFDPFFTTKPIGQGTGLGLSMIYGFARQTQGHASIHSIVGEGTTVNIYLPCNSSAIETPATQQQLVARSPKGQGQTVLFVEDEPGVRLVLGEVLGELGYVTYEAVDAPSALALEPSLGPLDLLVTDVGLPGINGRQLAEMMRQRRPNLKVLFVTGYANKATVKDEFLGRGMDMLAKPFTIDDLAHKVQTMLNTTMKEISPSDVNAADESVFGVLL